MGSNFSWLWSKDRYCTCIIRYFFCTVFNISSEYVLFLKFCIGWWFEWFYLELRSGLLQTEWQSPLKRNWRQVITILILHGVFDWIFLVARRHVREIKNLAVALINEELIGPFTDYLRGMTLSSTDLAQYCAQFWCSKRNRIYGLIHYRTTFRKIKCNKGYI